MRLIRPGTFEVAVHMARGVAFSLAPPVLANIYHGLNKMVTADNPSTSGSIFPAHYLYRWLAYYFGTHHELSNTQSPLMVNYTCYHGAKYYSDEKERKLIHDGFGFRASGLVPSKYSCKTVTDNSVLDAATKDYIISLRASYLPLRSKTSFFLEPYHPTRFSRQFGFYQDVPGELPRDADDGHIGHEVAERHFRLLLLTDIHLKMTLPGSPHRWNDMTTSSFRQWWCKVNVSDLRRSVSLLLASVDSKGRNKLSEPDCATPTPQPHLSSGKRPSSNDKDVEVREANLKKRREERKERDEVYLQLFGTPPNPSDENDKTPEASEPVLEPNPSHQTSRAINSTSTSKKSSTGGSSSSSASSLNSAEVTTAIFSEGAKMMAKVLFQKILDVPYDHVESTVSSCDSVFDAIKALGSDTSALRKLVDAYVSNVKEYLAAQKGAPIDVDLPALDISEVEASLQSARAAYNDAVHASEDQERRMASMAKKKVSLEASLRSLVDEETSLKDKHRQQLEVIKASKSKVASVSQQLEDVKASQERAKQLKMLESKLDKCKKALKNAM